MNIHFKRHFPWPGPEGQPAPTNFEQLISENLIFGFGGKTHTLLRLPANGLAKYQEGQELVFCMGTRFKPEKFAGAVCTGVQFVHMELVHQAIGNTLGLHIRPYGPGNEAPVQFAAALSHGDMHEIARNDGLSMPDFLKWFMLDLIQRGPGIYQIVHWGGLRYGF